jgi:hypothetical protein
MLGGVIGLDARDDDAVRRDAALLLAQYCWQRASDGSAWETTLAALRSDPDAEIELELKT